MNWIVVGIVTLGFIGFGAFIALQSLWFNFVFYSITDAWWGFVLAMAPTLIIIALLMGAIV